jgi:hypothetical protein
MNKIEVGTGVTIHYVTDCRPGTVIKVSPSGKTLTVQRDEWKVVKGSCHDGSAEYEYSRDPNGIIEVYSLRSNGRYVITGSDKRGTCLQIGIRRYYYDPHF